MKGHVAGRRADHSRYTKRGRFSGAASTRGRAASPVRRATFVTRHAALSPRSLVQGVTPMSKLTALVVATLALSIGADAALAKSQARVKGACPSVTILADATRLTQMQNGRIDLKAEIR